MSSSCVVSGPGAPTEQTGNPPSQFVGYLTPKMAAAYLSISIPELERLRRVGGGPRFRAVSPKVVRYAIRDLDAWMDGFAVSNTSEVYERRQAGQGAGRE